MVYEFAARAPVKGHLAGSQAPQDVMAEGEIKIAHICISHCS